MEDCFAANIKVLTPEESLKKRPSLYASCLKGSDEKYRIMAEEVLAKALKSEDIEIKKVAEDILAGVYD